MGALPQENERHEPLPLDPVGQRLCLTFPYLWQAIVGVNDAVPQWQTVQKYPLRPRVLWRLWQDSSQLVGVRFASQTRYALIDIDAKSDFHPQQNPEALTTIRSALETIGIYRTLLVRSSWSGGLHLYIPLPEGVPTFGLASALKQCLEAQSMPIAQGQIEVFPNCKSYATPGHYTEYNAHRLPLQPHSGSCLLDADYNPITQNIGRFFEQWDLAAAAQDMAELRQAMTTAKHNRRGKRHRQTTVVDEWLQDLRQEMEEGWTDYGQTNHLLKTIACYGVVFEGLKGDALTEFVHTTAIQSPGFSQWCRHQQQIQMKASVWAKAAEGYYWKLGDERTRQSQLHGIEGDPAGVSANVLRSEDAQRRIREAVAQLEAENRLPFAVTARAKAIAAQGAISLRTLYRHLSLWHPEHSITIERSGKTPCPEVNTTDPPEKKEMEERSAKPREDGEFYTNFQLMKGVVSDSGSVDSSDPPIARRLSFTDFSKFESSAVTPKGSWSKPSDSDSVIQLTFPQLQVEQPDGYQIEMSCSQAILMGDRAWVLQRLFSLWREGHHDLIRSLCRLHPAWGFEVKETGPVEVQSHES